MCREEGTTPVSAFLKWRGRSIFVSQSCKAFESWLTSTSLTFRTDVSTRLGVIESLLSRLVASTPQQHSQPLQNLVSGRSSPDMSSLTPSGEEFFHPQSHPDGTRRQPHPQKPPPSGTFPPHVSQSSGHGGFGWGLKEARMIHLLDDENPDLRPILNVLKESGIAKGHIEWIIAGVPGRRLADGLIDLYFR